jgi:hypothetical protein
MAHRKVNVATIHEASDLAYQPLVALVETMAEEIKRLDEDNTQLRAAVSMYRAALEKYRVRATTPA